MGKWDVALHAAELAIKAGTMDRSTAEDLLGDAFSEILQTMSQSGLTALGAVLGGLAAAGNPYAAFLGGFFGFMGAFAFNQATSSQYDALGDALAAAVFDLAIDGPDAFADALSGIFYAIYTMEDGNNISFQSIINGNSSEHGVVDWRGVFEDLFLVENPPFSG